MAVGKATADASKVFDALPQAPTFAIAAADGCSPGVEGACVTFGWMLPMFRQEWARTAAQKGDVLSLLAMTIATSILRC